MPSAAKQHLQEREGVGMTSSSPLSAGGVGMGAAAAGCAAVPNGYHYGGGSFTAVETMTFLKASDLCSRRLGASHDTFIYRGEVAFCSQECRKKQIEYDERMEQSCSLTSIKDASSVTGASSSD